MNKLIDEMVYETKNDRWIFLSELKSGEFYYNQKLVKVFTSDTGCKFYQTIWGNTTCQVRNWETCMDTIDDRMANEQHYAFLEHLNQQATAEWYNDDSFNYKGD